MSAVERLLKQLELRGLGVAPGAEPGTLLLTGPNGAKTPEIMAAVKAFKPQLLVKFAHPGRSPEEKDPPATEPEPP